MDEIKQIKKKRKKGALIALAIVVVLVAGFFAVGAAIRSGMNKSVYEAYTVKTGNIVKSVTATGTLAANDAQEIETLSGLTVKSVEKNPGDAVSAGDIIAVFDEKALSELIDTLSNRLAAADAELMSVTSSDELSVISPVKGTVKLIYAHKGDSALAAMRDDGALMVISTDGYLKIEFETDAALNVYDKLTLEDSDSRRRTATVSEVNQAHVVALVDDEQYGALEALSVYDGETLLAQDVLTMINAPYTVSCSSGKVNRVHVALDDKVSAGTKLYTLTDCVPSAFSSRLSAREELSDALEKALDIQNSGCALISQSEGVIKSLNLVKGMNVEQLDPSQLTTTVGELVERGTLFEMVSEIDELDILSLKVGLGATITVEAIGDKEYSGEITNVSAMGTAMNGVTTYKITIALNDADPSILEGMNASATIITQQSTAVLTVPLELLHSDTDGNQFVYVSSTGSTDGSDMLKTPVETGLSDGIIVEITKGLNAGDMVMYQSSSNAFSGMMKLWGMDRE